MTADEILNAMNAEEDTPVCIIDPETRTITVPPEYQLLGVENDKKVERIYFQCPKIVGDNQDLSQDYQLFVNYQNANGDPDAYKIEDMQVEGDNITFSWLLEENVTKYRGDIQFAFGAIISGDAPGDPDKNRWNTTINTDCTVLTGLKCTQQVAESNPDALAQIWAAIDELKLSGGGGTGSGVTTDHANTLWAIIQKTAFAEQLTDEELTAFKRAWGIEAVVVPATGITLNKTTLSFMDSSSQTLIATVEPSNSTDSVTWETSDAGIATVSSGVVSPVSNGSCTITAKAGSYSASCKVTVNVSGEIVTLQSISATYAGGEVTVGTALTDLTGVTVTAHYSDGSTATITGYILSGEIVEGKNTITVSYDGKTTTFMVTGVASGGTESNIAYLPVTYMGSEYWAYFPEVVAGDVYYINYNISQYAVLRDFSPWTAVSASETTWTYEKYNDNYYKITFVTDYGDIGLKNNSSWADLEYSTVKYSKNAVPVE